jgi:hypothetical protein
MGYRVKNFRILLIVVELLKPLINLGSQPKYRAISQKTILNQIIPIFTQ